MDQDLELTASSGLIASNYYENLRGAGEKYLQGAGNQWYFVLANGEFYRWTGSIAGSQMLETLDTSYHADPSTLHEAQMPGSAPVTLAVNDQTGVLTITPAPGFVGDFQVNVTVSDGVGQATQSFTVSVVDNAMSQLFAAEGGDDQVDALFGGEESASDAEVSDQIFASLAEEEALC